MPNRDSGTFFTARWSFAFDADKEVNAYREHVLAVHSLISLAIRCVY